MTARPTERRTAAAASVPASLTPSPHSNPVPTLVPTPAHPASRAIRVRRSPR
ncbi:hypothetical protein [Streptomyces sp. NPDC006739]|uniref:hypothetical protein n=1 Tax=Streptomyces sp. NPDC006739 TaxID=3364763 RepID=UPI0036B3C471